MILLVTNMFFFWISYLIYLVIISKIAKKEIVNNVFKKFIVIEVLKNFVSKTWHVLCHLQPTDN